MSSEPADSETRGPIGSRTRNPRRFIRRLDLRLTAWFSLVLLLTSMTLFGLTLWNLYRTLTFEDRQELQNRVLGHWARYQAAESDEVGITRLVNDIQTETMAIGDRPYFVRIATASNRDVFVRIPLVEWQFAFDLSILFDGDTPHSAGFLTIPSEILGYDLEVIGYPLSENYIIQIGMDTATRDQVLRLFRTSFLFTFAILFGVSVLGGLFFTSRSLRPIGALNDTIKSIVKTGDFGQRIPQAGAGDDLDDLVHSFNSMLDRIEQLVYGMRDALDAVAHDLRTPMTRFRATAEAALASDGGETTSIEALGSALEESDQILRMLSSMMDISEANAGAMSLRLKPVDLARLIREVVDVYSIVAEDADVSIAVDLESLEIEADAGRLQQVVGNLLDNAVKYATPGTQVEVKLRPVGNPDRDPADAEIRVRNRGAGISPEELPHIWTRMYRGSDGKRSGGLGLGLTLVRAIVTAHGGSADVESVSGEFVEFRIQLPAIQQSPS